MSGRQRVEEGKTVTPLAPSPSKIFTSIPLIITLERCFMFKRDELIKIAESNPIALVDIIMELQNHILKLQQRIEELESRLNKNSSNSNKPPSSDGFVKKTKSLRKKSGRKPGGQYGHPGSTLKQIPNPDHFVVLPLDHADCCNNPDLHIIDYESRQVFELPKPKLEVTEYRSEIGFCSSCNKTTRAKFPDSVIAPVQYGHRFLSFLVYLHHQQLIPANRITQLCDDLFGYPVSESTVFQACQKCHDNLENFHNSLVSQLVNAHSLHVDESGIRVSNKLHWIHSASTDKLTFYGIHEKRGSDAIDDFDIIPNFQGYLIHDFWKPYLNYDCNHSLCNTHHLRELKFLYEQHNQSWASDMSKLLNDMHSFAEKKINKSSQLTSRQKSPWLKQYQNIITEGLDANPIEKPLIKKRGKPKKSKARNLLERLNDYESFVLAFLHDLNVPFTNNQAEQDIRMIKVRQKISGCFRTMKGAMHFARIRSYLSTVRKHNLNSISAITDAISGNSFIPQCL
ncbi:MAG: IS66 family transposase [Colwellia sp.]|nr:IS66 family transposase [Colwellia sp.]